MSELPYEKKQNANVINRFLHSGRYRHLKRFVRTKFKNKENIKILDIGCGPGGAYVALSEEFSIEYFGVDIREDFIDVAKKRHGEDFFSIDDVTKEDFDFTNYNLIIALETFEHIPESKLVRVIERISDSKPDYLFCSVPIEIGPSVAIKNLGSRFLGYNRMSGNIRETLEAARYNLNALPPHGIAHLGFNWIWLEQTLRHNLKIEGSYSLPFRWLPKFLAPSIYFICKNY